MKKCVFFILLCLILLLLPACAVFNASYVVDDVDALKEEVNAAWKARTGSSTIDLLYLGSSKGYHIVEFYNTAQWPAVTTKNVAGYEFTRYNSFQLMAYKDGELIELKDAYASGLVSEEAIAKASSLSAEKKDATK